MTAALRPRRREPDRAGDARAQRRRRGLGRQLVPQGLAQRLDARALGRERRVGGDARLDRQRIGRIELAVDGRMHQQPLAFVGCAGHFCTPIVSIRRRRARASRDITVPIGTPVTSAISR